MSIRSSICLFMFVLQGCVLRVPFAGTLPGDSHLDMSGKFRLWRSGQLVLDLDEPCMMRVKAGESVYATETCDAAHRDAISVIATTPWSKQIRGTWVDAKRIEFAIDWKRDGLDPRAPDAAALAARPWDVSGAEWTPTEGEARQILTLSAAKDDAALGPAKTRPQ